jgi:hypothetical protein
MPRKQSTTGGANTDPGKRPDVMEVDARIGARVKRFRGRRPQASVATSMTSLLPESNWHQVLLTRIEAGKRPLRLSEAVVLADILGVTIDQLAYGEEAMALDKRAAAHELRNLHIHISARIAQLEEA